MPSAVRRYTCPGPPSAVVFGVVGRNTEGRKDFQLFPEPPPFLYHAFTVHIEPDTVANEIEFRVV